MEEEAPEVSGFSPVPCGRPDLAAYHVAMAACQGPVGAEGLRG